VEPINKLSDKNQSNDHHDKKTRNRDFVNWFVKDLELIGLIILVLLVAIPVIGLINRFLYGYQMKITDDEIRQKLLWITQNHYDLSVEQSKGANHTNSQIRFQNPSMTTKESFKTASGSERIFIGNGLPATHTQNIPKKPRAYNLSPVRSLNSRKTDLSDFNKGRINMITYLRRNVTRIILFAIQVGIFVLGFYAISQFFGYNVFSKIQLSVLTFISLFHLSAFFTNPANYLYFLASNYIADGDVISLPSAGVNIGIISEINTLHTRICVISKTPNKNTLSQMHHTDIEYSITVVRNDVLFMGPVTFLEDYSVVSLKTRD
jgi:hypothetical protein